MVSPQLSDGHQDRRSQLSRQAVKGLFKNNF